MRRKHYALTNPIAVAMESVSLLGSDRVKQLMAPVKAAVIALQYGQFSANFWRQLADGLNIAEELAKPPVNLANDHAAKFDDAQMVLFALYEQWRNRQTWTPRAEQLQAVKDALEIFEIQLEHVSVSEFEGVIARLSRRMREAIRGNGGAATVVMIDDATVRMTTL